MRLPWSLALCACLALSCDSANPEKRDFGVEDGFFHYVNGEQIPLVRDRNHLSIQFREGTSEERIRTLLRQHDLEEAGQVLPLLHFYARCRSKPAEAYYTTYGDTLSARLGNHPEVQYALPAFFDEFGGPTMLTDRLLVRFDSSLTQAAAQAKLDSLMQADHLRELPWDYVGSLRLLQSSKASPANALDLSIRYDPAAFMSASADFAFRIR